MSAIVGKPQAAFGITGGACNTPISAYYISLLLRVATIALDMDGGVYWFLVSACMFSYVACESVRTFMLSSSLTDEVEAQCKLRGWKRAYSEPEQAPP